MKFKATIEVTVNVRLFAGESGTLPTEEEVVAALRDYFGGELIEYKALAESGYFDAVVEVEVDKIEQVVS